MIPSKGQLVGHVKARVGWPVSWVLAMPLLAAAPPTRCLARGCMSRTDVMRTLLEQTEGVGNELATEGQERPVHLRSAVDFRFTLPIKPRSRGSECGPPLRVRSHASTMGALDGKPEIPVGTGCFVSSGLPPWLFVKLAHDLPTHRRPAVHRCPCAPFPTPSSTRFSSSQVRLPSAWRRTGTRRALAVGSAHLGKGVDGWGRSADRAWARPARRCFCLVNDHVWCAGIGLLLSSAPPHQIAQPAPTSSMAARAALNRRPASSIVHILPYAIVTVALSRLAGPSPVAPCAREF